MFDTFGGVGGSGRGRAGLWVAQLLKKKRNQDNLLNRFFYCITQVWLVISKWWWCSIAKKTKPCLSRMTTCCNSFHLSNLLTLLVVNVSFLYMTVLSSRKAAMNKSNQRQHKTWMALNEAAESQVIFLNFHNRFYTKKTAMTEFKWLVQTASSQQKPHHHHHHHITEPAFQEAGCSLFHGCWPYVYIVNCLWELFQVSK